MAEFGSARKKTKVAHPPACGAELIQEAHLPLSIGLCSDSTLRTQRYLQLAMVWKPAGMSLRGPLQPVSSQRQPLHHILPGLLRKVKGLSSQATATGEAGIVGMNEGIAQKGAASLLLIGGTPDVTKALWSAEIISCPLFYFFFHHCFPPQSTEKFLLS